MVKLSLIICNQPTECHISSCINIYCLKNYKHFTNTSKTNRTNTSAPAASRLTAPELPLQIPLAPRCGQGSELGLHARITSGRGERGEAGYGEYPWHVGVLAQDLTYLCAGVLVAARLVLTVAHCVAPRSPHETLVARVGDWDLAAADELYPAYDVDIFGIIVHPGVWALNNILMICQSLK